MNKYVETFNILLMIASVIAASVWAAHIPPLWLPFGLAVAVLLFTLTVHRKGTKTRLQTARSEHHPLHVFGEMISGSLHLVSALMHKNEITPEDVDRLEDLVEANTTRMERIHPQLTETLGMKTFIDLILPFARSERMINRALSAMMDGYFDEAKRDLQESLPYLQKSERILKEITKLNLQSEPIK